jgi:PAS domain S-box-containing protein
VGAIIVLWWRRQQFQFYRERYEAEIERRAVEERAAQALQESESRFRAIFEQAAIGMADSSLDARFIRVNQRFCEIMGYSREELLGLTFREITHPDDLARDEQLVAQLLSGELSSFAVEKRYLRKDGGVVWANLMLSLHRSPSGDPVHFVAVVEDITGQKRAEEERRNLERQLLQAQKMESVGRLAGGVAHDFNNHLMVINGYCAMLLDEMGPTIRCGSQWRRFCWRAIGRRRSPANCWRSAESRWPSHASSASTTWWPTPARCYPG